MEKERIIDLIIDDNNIAKISKALSSNTRWRILKLLRMKKMDVSRIANALKQTEANISAQIKILEKAGLVIAKYQPGEHGVRKVCEPACEKVIFKIIDKE